MPSKPIIEHGGDQPYYNWKGDKVKVPHHENFILSDEYHATLFHELVHSRGHESRLNRENLHETIRLRIARLLQEELVAEIATCFLCGESGITNTVIDNSSGLHAILD